MDKKIEELENELKVLKNEIKETLTDIREHLLTNVENPFPLELTREVLLRPAAEKYSAMPDDDEAAIEVKGQHLIPGGPGGILGGGGVSGVAAAGSDGKIPAPEVNLKAQAPAARKAVDGIEGLTASIEPTEDEEEDEATDIASELMSRMASGNGHGGNGKGSPLVPGREEREDVQEKTGLKSEPRSPGREQGMNADMVTVAMMASWAEDGIRRIGRRRLKVTVEVYSSMGGLSNQLKDVLLQLISLDGSDGSTAKVPLRECLRVLADLDNLFLRSRFDRSGAALLSVLLNGRDSANSR